MPAPAGRGVVGRLLWPEIGCRTAGRPRSGSVPLPAAPTNNARSPSQVGMQEFFTIRDPSPARVKPFQQVLRESSEVWRRSQYPHERNTNLGSHTPSRRSSSRGALGGINSSLKDQAESIESILADADTMSVVSGSSTARGRGANRSLFADMDASSSPEAIIRQGSRPFRNSGFTTPRPPGFQQRGPIYGAFEADVVSSPERARQGSRPRRDSGVLTPTQPLLMGSRATRTTDAGRITRDVLRVLDRTTPEKVPKLVDPLENRVAAANSKLAWTSAATIALAGGPASVRN